MTELSVEATPTDYRPRQEGYRKGGTRHDDCLGGLVARNRGTITGSYSAAMVSTDPDSEYVSLSGLVQNNSGQVAIQLLGYAETTEQDSMRRSLRAKPLPSCRSPTSNTGIYATWNPNWWDFGTSSQYPGAEGGGVERGGPAG